MTDFICLKCGGAKVIWWMRPGNRPTSSPCPECMVVEIASDANETEAAIERFKTAIDQILSMPLATKGSTQYKMGYAAHKKAVYEMLAPLKNTSAIVGSTNSSE